MVDLWCVLAPFGQKATVRGWVFSLCMAVAWGLVTFGALACSDSRSLARVTPLFLSFFEFRASDPPPCPFGGAKLFRVVLKFGDVNPGMERLLIAATLPNRSTKGVLGGEA